MLTNVLESKLKPVRFVQKKSFSVTKTHVKIFKDGFLSDKKAAYQESWSKTLKLDFYLIQYSYSYSRSSFLGHL